MKSSTCRNERRWRRSRDRRLGIGQRTAAHPKEEELAAPVAIQQFGEDDEEQLGYSVPWSWGGMGMHAKIGQGGKGKSEDTVAGWRAP
jgi:hypothetical protein